MPQSESNVRTLPFRKIDLGDPFFDSLKGDYKEFSDWFLRKADSNANVMYDEHGRLLAFLFLKVEDGPASDLEPPLPAKRRMKVGTFKINAHGTKLGERFIKRLFDETIAQGIDEIYLTVFERHKGLIELLSRYGFEEIGVKNTQNGTEKVFSKNLPGMSGDILKDYPTIHLAGRNKFLLGIYPKFHTRLLPDSILNTEAFDVLDDVSHTNSIHKLYICRMQGIEALRRGDILVIYRTSDQDGKAWYRSVATSFGVVEEVRRLSDFSDSSEFLKYAKPHSVFSEGELLGLWKDSRYRAIKFTYNSALKKRVNRKSLCENAGLDPNAYSGFMQLTDEQFNKIAELGNVEKSLIIN